MTNFEKIKEMSIDELSSFLCRFVDVEVEDCDKCPATKYCRRGCNGFKVWLESEAKEEEKNPYLI